MRIFNKDFNAVNYKKEKNNLNSNEMILSMEPFYTIQGEGKYSGQASFFIRTAYCTLRCSFCSISSTKISTTNGMKSIKDIEVGDQVLSYDELNKKIIPDTVIRLQSRLVNPDDLLCLTINEDSTTKKIIVTKDHRFYIKDKWVEAQDTQINDEIYTLDYNSWKMLNNNPMFDKLIISKQLNTKSSRTYNIKRNEEQKIKYSKSKIGEKNPRYIGKTRNDFDIKKVDKNYQQTRLSALERDSYTCQDCGSKERLEVHHIVPFRDTMDNSLNNLKTLCKSCHVKADNEIIYKQRAEKMFHNGKKIISIDKLNIKQIARLSENKTKDGQIKVYSLTTENNHNYFTQTVLSHNCDAYEWDQFKIKTSFEDIHSKMLEQNKECKLIILTGGEPSLQCSKEFIDFFKNKGYQINIETSGSYYNESLKDIDYVCCSPKKLSDQQGFNPNTKDKYILNREIIPLVDEFKFIIEEKTNVSALLDIVNSIKEQNNKCIFYLSPMDLYSEDKNKENIKKLVNLILEYPNTFKSSLQTHKILNVL